VAFLEKREAAQKSQKKNKKSKIKWDFSDSSETPK
jgi:hypothetical protein